MIQEHAKTYYWLVKLPSHLCYTYHSFESFLIGDIVLLPNIHLDRLPIKGTIVAQANPMERTKAIIMLVPTDNCVFKIEHSCEYTGKLCHHPNPICKHWGINDVT